MFESTDMNRKPRNCNYYDCSEHTQKSGQDDEIHLILRFATVEIETNIRNIKNIKK